MKNINITICKFVTLQLEFICIFFITAPFVATDRQNEEGNRYSRTLHGCTVFALIIVRRRRRNRGEFCRCLLIMRFSCSLLLRYFQARGNRKVIIIFVLFNDCPVIDERGPCLTVSHYHLILLLYVMRVCRQKVIIMLPQTT